MLPQDLTCAAKVESYALMMTVMLGCSERSDAALVTVK